MSMYYLQTDSLVESFNSPLVFVTKANKKVQICVAIVVKILYIHDTLH